MNNIKFMSSRAQRRASERALKKQAQKSCKNAVNSAFSKIQAPLTKMGWKTITNFAKFDYVDGKPCIKVSIALKLCTYQYYVLLIPYKDGIEIYRFEIWEEHRGKGIGKELFKNLIQFLNSQGIIDIYFVPSVPFYDVARFKNKSELDVVENFLFKRGFRKQSLFPYWKLQDLGYLNEILKTQIDFNILTSPNELNDTTKTLAPHEVTEEIIDNEFVENGVFVSCEYKNTPHLNFIAIYNFYSYEIMLSKILGSINKIPDDNKNVKAFNGFVIKMCIALRHRKISEYEIQFLQRIYAIYIKYASEHLDIKNATAYWAYGIIGFLHINLQGNENNIKEYRLVFDEENCILDISYSTSKAA